MRTPKRKTHPEGFTMAELLIVVAIIAVLVAIAIPVFTSQLEKSRMVTDMNNIRSDYEQAVAQFILPSEGTESTAVQGQKLPVIKEPTTLVQNKPVIENVKFSADPPPRADLPEQPDITTAEHIHSWGDISYTWSTKNDACTAVKSCKTCPAVLKYVSKEVAVQQKNAPSCTAEGSALLTAIFEDTSLNTSLSVTLPTIDHVADEPVLVILTDSTCTKEGSGENVVS